MVQVWRVFSAVWLVPLLLTGSIVAVVLVGRLGWIVVGLAVVWLAVAIGWYQPARYRRWRWRLTSLALLLDRGVLVRHRSAVPYFRIQQIDVVQGPVDRLLGLATLQVTTAAASGSATLPGIDASEAPSVRAELLWRAAQAVETYPGELSDAV